MYDTCWSDDARRRARAAVLLALALATATAGCEGADTDAQLASLQQALGTHRYFEILVVDGADRPVPCARIRSNDGTMHVADHDGRIAFYEPGLMGLDVIFSGLAPENQVDVLADNERIPLGVHRAQEGGMAVLRWQDPPTFEHCGSWRDYHGRLLAEGTVAPGDQRLEIRVVDWTEEGLPLPGVRVVPMRDGVYGPELFSDNNGLIAFYHPQLMDQWVELQVTAHGYTLHGDEDSPFPVTKSALVPVFTGRGTTALLNMTPDAGQVAARVARLTGSGRHRETALLGGMVPAGGNLAGCVAGQDGGHAVLHGNRLFFAWGDTVRPNGLSNRGTVAWAYPGQDPDIAPVLDYVTPDGGSCSKVAAPEALFPHPTRMGPLLWWPGGLTSVPDQHGIDRLFATFHQGIALGREQDADGNDLGMDQRGIARWDEGVEIFEPVSGTLQPGVRPTPDGTALRYDHGALDGEYVYYANGTRVRASAEQVEQANFEAYTFDVSADDEYGWRSDLPLVREQEGAGSVSLSKRLDMHLRDHLETSVLSGSPAGHRFPYSTLAHNALRQRFIKITHRPWPNHDQVYYAEADTPMGPWVYAAQVVSYAGKDNGTYGLPQQGSYRPALHPHWDQEGGRVVYFELSHVIHPRTKDFASFGYELGPHNYNQVLHRLEVDDPALDVPVPIYDLRGEDSRRTLADKAGLRRHMDAPKVAFFAHDIPRNGAGFSWAGPCSGGRLVPYSHDDVAFYAVPAEWGNAQLPNLVALWEYSQAATGRYAYSVAAEPDPQLLAEGFTRGPDVFAWVWRNPIHVELPVQDYLQPALAYAGPDRCLSAGTAGTATITLDRAHSDSTRGAITHWLWAWPGGSSTAAAPAPTLPLGKHRISLMVWDAAGNSHADEMMVEVQWPEDSVPWNARMHLRVEHGLSLHARDGASKPTVKNADYGKPQSFFTLIRRKSKNGSRISYGDTIRLRANDGRYVRHDTSNATMGSGGSQADWIVTGGSGLLREGKSFSLRAADTPSGDPKHLKGKTDGVVRVLRGLGGSARWQLIP